jgi:hypothetical protein
VKIRCTVAQKQQWQKAAGLANVSTWARDVLDRAVTQREAKLHRAAADVPRASRMVSTPAEARRAADELKATAAGQCRHGLLNCRVCQTGVFSA